MKVLANKHKKCDILYKKNEKKHMHPTLYYLDEKRDLFFDELSIVSKKHKQVDIVFNGSFKNFNKERCQQIIKQSSCKFHVFVEKKSKELIIFFSQFNKKQVAISFLKKASPIKPTQIYTEYRKETHTIFPTPSIVEEMELASQDTPYGECFLILGEKGTAKSAYAKFIASADAAYDRVLEITANVRHNGKLALQLLGSKRGSFTDAQDHDGLLIKLLDRANKEKKRCYFILNELQNLTIEESQLFYTALNDSDKYIVNEKTGEKVSTEYLSFVFTSTDSYQQLEDKFGDAFMSRINFYTLQSVPYRNLDFLTKHALIEHIICEELGKKNIESIKICSTAIDWFLENDFSGNIRDLSYYIKKKCFNSSTNIVNREDVDPEYKSYRDFYCDLESLLPNDFPHMNKAVFDSLEESLETFSSEELIDMADFAFYMELLGSEYRNGGNSVVEDLYQLRNLVSVSKDINVFLKENNGKLPENGNVFQIKHNETVFYLNAIKNKKDSVEFECETMQGEQKFLKLKDLENAEILYFEKAFTMDALKKRFALFNKRFGSLDRAIRCSNDCLFFDKDFSSFLRENEFNILVNRCKESRYLNEYCIINSAFDASAINGINLTDFDSSVRTKIRKNLHERLLDSRVPFSWCIYGKQVTKAFLQILSEYSQRELRFLIKLAELKINKKNMSQTSLCNKKKRLENSFIISKTSINWQKLEIV